jgi:hypothetical protein
LVVQKGASSFYLNMARAEARAYKGVWWQCPQWGQGKVSGQWVRGGEAPFEADAFFSFKKHRFNNF